MAEEKTSPIIQNSMPTLDDISVLRILLHNVKGISSVSTISTVAQYDDSAA